MTQSIARQETTMEEVGTLQYYIYSKNVKEITESTSKYQFQEKEASQENDPELDEFDSSSDEESSIMADEVDDRAVRLVGRTYI